MYSCAMSGNGSTCRAATSFVASSQRASSSASLSATAPISTSSSLTRNSRFTLPRLLKATPPRHAAQAVQARRRGRPTRRADTAARRRGRSWTRCRRSTRRRSGAGSQRNPTPSTPISAIATTRQSASTQAPRRQLSLPARWTHTATRSEPDVLSARGAPGQVFLVDMNPLGGLTQPLLFEWHELSGPDAAQAGPELRLVASATAIRPAMSMYAHTPPARATLFRCLRSSEAASVRLRGARWPACELLRGQGSTATLALRVSG